MATIDWIGALSECQPKGRKNHAALKSRDFVLGWDGFSERSGIGTHSPGGAGPTRIYPSRRHPWRRARDREAIRHLHDRAGSAGCGRHEKEAKAPLSSQVAGQNGGLL
jgi:hypothetical protein